jgi:methylmalonyl-CoA mutase cobalamin-binding subunit
MSTAELLAEFSEYRDPQIHHQTPGNVPAMNGQVRHATAPLASARDYYRSFPVVCIAASDEADELSATMLAQLLEQNGFNTILLPLAAVTTEILARLGEDRETVVCISALPPFAFTAARTIAARIRQQMPHNRLLIGLWQTDQDAENLRSRFGSARPSALVSTLAEAVEQVTGWDSNSSQNLPKTVPVPKPVVVPSEA